MHTMMFWNHPEWHEAWTNPTFWLCGAIFVGVWIIWELCRE
jgi:hypothetical protein